MIELQSNKIPLVNNRKTHSDLARQKAGGEWVLCRPSGGSKDRNDLRGRSRSGIEGFTLDRSFLGRQRQDEKRVSGLLFFQRVTEQWRPCFG